MVLAICKHVFRLQVSVYHPIVVQVACCLQNLLHAVAQDLLTGKLNGKDVVQEATRYMLTYNDELLVALKDIKRSHYIRMAYAPKALQFLVTKPVTASTLVDKFGSKLLSCQNIGHHFHHGEASLSDKSPTLVVHLKLPRNCVLQRPHPLCKRVEAACKQRDGLHIRNLDVDLPGLLVAREYCLCYIYGPGCTGALGSIARQLSSFQLEKSCDTKFHALAWLLQKALHLAEAQISKYGGLSP
mmetsp:Transcript_6679/g.20239  ORF Transcript_6679/g.20239 Transcript_6679/m.20239 type:complete len:242 (+) Transcript_6679:3505-4230(+)